ncbi:MAG: aminotransferase class V-fold PLP-dependent enzyme, partial [Lachnospiraceae bacterium]|nr:aminotransferase class V-fold PLP-dependent enzyme [Lachnospiraceae bacterium]
MSVREAYLDNAATTRAFDSVTDVMVKVLASDYGNPSSMHTKGMEAERFVKQAREEIAAALKCEPRQIVFTSGGTESNNTSISTAVRTLRHEGRHIVTTPFEHDSVSEPMKALEKEGYEVTRVPVDGCGIVDLQALREALRPDTVLVSVMYVNNEIGAVQPVAEIAKLVHEL